MSFDDITFIIGILVLTINVLTLLVLVLLIIYRSNSRTVFMCLMNLVVSDIGVGIFLIVQQYYVFDRRACTAFIGYGLTTLFASLLSLTFVTIDRFFYLYHDVFYKTWFNVVRTTACIFVMWAISALIGFAPLDWSNTRKSECNFVTASRPTSILFRSLMVFFLIICVIIVFCTIIYRQIRHYPMSTLPTFFQVRAKSVYGLTPEITIKSMLMASLLLILWMPNIILSLLYELLNDEDKKKMKDSGIPITMLMVYSNSIVNPILYTWLNYGVYSYLFQRCLPKTDSESVTSTL